MGATERPRLRRRALLGAIVVAMHWALWRALSPLSALPTRATVRHIPALIAVVLATAPPHRSASRRRTFLIRSASNLSVHAPVRVHRHRSTISVPQRPAKRTHIDWMGALRREVRAFEASHVPHEVHFGFSRRNAFAPSPHRAPWDGWDYAATHRIEELPQGGTLINLTDHCSLVLAPFPVIGCRLGQSKIRGNLFAHMRGRAHDGLP